MLLDAATLQKSSEMHPEIAEFLKANPSSPPSWDDAPAMRAFIDGITQHMLAGVGPAEPAIIVEYKDIPMRDGFQSTIKIHRPATRPAGGSPVMVSFFGGGWISGDKEAGTIQARAYTRAFGATVVDASYRLSPEHKFPVAQHDCWDTVAWVDAHAAAELRADLAQGFLVSGISAGGSNAAAVTVHFAEDKARLAHPITGQYLCVPSLLGWDVPERFRAHFLAHEHNRYAPILPFASIAALQHHTGWDDASPWRFVTNSPAPVASMPPTYIQVDGMDILRDDGLIYDEMLKEAGVPSKIDFYPGCPHAHHLFFPGLELTNKALGDLMVGVGWLLGKEITPEQGLAAFAPPPS